MRTTKIPAQGITGHAALEAHTSGRRVASRFAGGVAAVALVLGAASFTPAAAQNAPLALPQQGQSLAAPGKAKPARPAKKTRPQSSGRVERSAPQEFRQPSYEDLARQGSEESGTSIRPSFRGGKPALNLGF